MIQKLIKIGNSIGVIVPHHILESKGIIEGDEVKIQISKVAKAKKEVSLKLSSDDKKIAQLTKSFIDHYRKDLEALAQE